MRRSVRRRRPFSTPFTGQVTLDCTGLEYMSSAGLGVLLKTQKRLLATSGKLRLTGVNRHLQDIFTLFGLRPDHRDRAGRLTVPAANFSAPPRVIVR